MVRPVVTSVCALACASMCVSAIRTGSLQVDEVYLICLGIIGGLLNCIQHCLSQ